MTTYRLLITVSGYCMGVVQAATEAAAREIFGNGDWAETHTIYTYELEAIEEIEADTEA